MTGLSKNGPLVPCVYGLQKRPNCLAAVSCTIKVPVEPRKVPQHWDQYSGISANVHKIIPICHFSDMEKQTVFIKIRIQEPRTPNLILKSPSHQHHNPTKKAFSYQRYRVDQNGLWGYKRTFYCRIKDE